MQLAHCVLTDMTLLLLYDDAADDDDAAAASAVRFTLLASLKTPP